MRLSSGRRYTVRSLDALSDDLLKEFCLDTDYNTLSTRRGTEL